MGEGHATRAPKFKLRNDLIRPPALRHGRKEGERHATWMELFTDLAFVAAVGQLGAELASNPSLPLLGRSFALFVMIWWAWVGNTFYMSRFDADDLVHRLMSLLHIGLVALLGAGVPRAMGGDFTLFTVSYALIRVLLVVQYASARKFNPEARELTSLYVKGFSIGPALLAVSLVVAPPYKYLLWALAVAADLWVPLQPKVKKLLFAFPPNEHHVPERFGLFTIIVLGESILAAVAATQMTKGEAQYWVVGGLGVALAFCVWWVYFEGVKGADARIPSSWKDQGRYQLWLYSHLPLQFCIVLIAVGIKLAMKAKDGYVLPLDQGWILLGGTVGAMVACHLLYISTMTDCLRSRAWQISQLHWMVTLGTLGIGFWAVTQSALVLAGVATVMYGGHVFLTFRENRLDTDPPREAPHQH